MYSGDRYAALVHDPALLVAVVFYVIVTVIFLLNMLIAQLNCSYLSIFEDMQGMARMKRGKVVLECMPSVSQSRWEKFATSLEFESRLEFNEGDVGLAGGIQLLEPANANPTTVDMIRRFGGSTSPSQQWPEEDTNTDEDADRFEKLEATIQKAMKRLASGAKGTKGKGGNSSLGQSGSGSGQEDSGGGGGDASGSGEHSSKGDED